VELDKAITARLKADRWDEAIARAEELLALRKRVQGQNHYETVSAEWRLKALRRVAPMPPSDRADFQSAQAMDEQADSLYKKGKYSQAGPLCEKSLEVRRRLLPGDHPLTADSYELLAFSLMYKGKYPQAQSLLEKSLEIRRRTLSDDHPDTADSYHNLAYDLWRQGKFTQAQPLFEKAVATSRRLLGDEHSKTAAFSNNLALNLNDRGEYALAQPLLEKALETRRRLLGEDHADTATSYNSLAYNLNAQSRYAEAQPLYLKALEINRRTLTDDHPFTALTYNNVAANLSAQGMHALALPLYQKALEIGQRLLTDDHPRTLLYYNNVAYCLNEQGRYAEAQPLCERGLEMRRRLLGDEHPDTAHSYNSLAYNLLKQGKYVQAQPLYERVLDIRQRLLGDEHPNTAFSYGMLARDLHAQGKYREARDRWLEGAKSQDKSRLRVAFTGLERAGAGEGYLRPALAAVLARLGQPAEAWQALEEDMGRGLLDELASRQDRRLPPAERVRLRELTTELEEFDRLAESTTREPEQAERAKRLEDLRRQRAQASIALGEFRAKLVRDYGPLAGQVAALHEVQLAIPADTALVGWVDISPAGPSAADPDGEHWGVVVRSRGLPTWVPITGSGPDGRWTDDDDALAGRVRRALRLPPGAGPAHLRHRLEELRTQRLEPLTKALAAVAEGLPPPRRLIVLPSRNMEGVPIEVLLPPGDTRTVSYAPSATVLKYLRDQPRPNRHAGLLALGDPVCSPPLPGTRLEVKALAALFQSDDRPTRTLLGDDASEAALDQISRSGDLGRFGFIHLAAHGMIDEDVPARSAVILTQTGLPDPLDQALSHKPVFDGRLLVREIQRGWEMRAELVTLSACETALGRQAGGEGFVGFTQALLMSGARSVCLSLWRVDDMATALLMQRYYANMLGRRPGLTGSMPKVDALHEAKSWLRELRRAEALGLIAEFSGGAKQSKAVKTRHEAKASAEIPTGGGDLPYASPLFWGAFVLSGDPD
jgi:CHAT domain-containing protein/tetratricopeptide (TPR) repeat protein